MRKVIVFQHVAHKILGTLNPNLRQSGLRIRYVNFDRNPEECPDINKYHGLIVLGGHMGVYESDKYDHIKTECKLIEEALKKEIPILGICLGSQLLAHVLGAQVKKHSHREVGWCDVNFLDTAKQDPLFSEFKNTEKLFQLHGDTFDIPKSAVHLAQSDTCFSQAFRYGEKAYGIQFHLEVDVPMIERWFTYPQNLLDAKETLGENAKDIILNDTTKHIHRSLELSHHCFRQFINFFNIPEKNLLLGSNETKKRL